MGYDIFKILYNTTSGICSGVYGVASGSQHGLLIPSGASGDYPIQSIQQSGKLLFYSDGTTTRIFVASGSLWSYLNL